MSVSPNWRFEGGPTTLSRGSSAVEIGRRISPDSGTGSWAFLPASSVGASENLDGSTLKELVGYLTDLQHPNIVRVLGVSSDATSHGPTVIAERTSGWLGQQLAHQTIDTNTALGVFRDIATALAYIHSRGVAHGEVNLSSITLSVGSSTGCKILPNVKGLRVESLAHAQSEDVRSLALCFLAIVIAPQKLSANDVAGGLTRENEERLVLAGLSKSTRRVVAECLSDAPTAQGLVDMLEELDWADVMQCDSVRVRSHSLTSPRPSSARHSRSRRPGSVVSDADSAFSEDHESLSCGNIPLSLAASRSMSRRVSGTSTPSIHAFPGLHIGSHDSPHYRPSLDFGDSLSIHSPDGFGLQRGEEVVRQLSIVENELALERARYKFLERELAEERAERLLVSARAIDTFRKVKEVGDFNAATTWL